MIIFFVLPGYEMSEADGITAIQKQLTTLPKPNYTLLMYLWWVLFSVVQYRQYQMVMSEIRE